jgi:hypothetical protein
MRTRTRTTPWWRATLGALLLTPALLAGCGGEHDEDLEPPQLEAQPAALQAPYGGTPHQVPGTIQAEAFDEGGEGVAWHDTTPGNSGNEGRATDVDLQTCGDTSGCGFNVGWTKAGEWLEYTAQVAYTGTYTFEARVASPGVGGTFHLEVDGKDVTGPLTIPDTGAWQQYRSVRKEGVSLSAGTRVLRLVLDAVGPNGWMGNVNAFQLTAVPDSVWLSDLAWTSATNFWGPVERDLSNGEERLRDGRPLTLQGVTYPKGLGVHAGADIVFPLDGAYTTFLSDIGVDDEVGSGGSVVFQVYADGALLFDSGLMTGASATKQVQVDVTGRQVLRLVVGPGTDGRGYDHADWAGAKLVRALQAEVDVGPVTGKGGRISYVLNTRGRVSLLISDASGRRVRELLKAAPRGAGRQVEVWDGLDDQGQPVPAGTYTWKLLSTPGFKAEYITALGTNYPVGVHYNDIGAGTGVGPRAVIADDTGIYIGAGKTENIDNALFKMSLDGKTRLWSAMHANDWEGVQAFALDGTRLYALATTVSGEIWVYDRITGARQTVMAIAAPSKPTDIAAHAGTLIIAFQTAGKVRWLSTQGTLLAEATVTSPRAVAVNASGQAYVLTDTEVRTLNRDGTSNPVVGGLVSPRSLDVDRANGDILVAEGGDSQQVLRFTASGTLIKPYGDHPGGRPQGAYTVSAQRSFRDVADVAATVNRGFYVAEPFAAPRRVARLNFDGAVEAEWYGGQVWAPWVVVDPDDVTTVWMTSQWGWLMKLKVDYAARSWRVVATYRYDNLASGLVGGHDNAWLWGIAKRNGMTYLVKQDNRATLRVDEANQRLVPVSWGATLTKGVPDVLKPWMPQGAVSARWTDAGNGDGVPQQGEVMFSTISPNRPWTPYTADFEFYYYEAGGVRRVRPASFNAVNAPFYDKFPDGDLFTTTPSRVTYVEDRWGSFFGKDPQSGALFGAFNDRASFGTSEDSFVVKWRADGTQEWIVGGPTLGSASAFVPPGAIGTFRRVAGVIDGSVVLTDFYEGPRPGTTYVWDTDGLWVGGLLENPDLTVAKGWQYGLGAETLTSVIQRDPVSGNVYFYGTAVNEVRVYRITGWDGWQRASGEVTLATAPGTPPGTGFRADFYSDTALTTHVGTQHLAAVDLSDRSLPTVRGVRWTGELLPSATGTWSFTVRATDGVRLWVDGRLVVDSWMDTSGSRDVTRTAELVADRRTRVQLEYYRRTSTGNCQLFWRPPGGTTQGVAVSRVVPTNPLSLEPEAAGTGLLGEYFNGTSFDPAKRVYTQVDSTVNFNWGNEKYGTLSTPPGVTYPFSVRWTGTLVPRQTGYYSMTPTLAGARLWVDGNEVAEPYERVRAERELIYLEAGRSYSVRVQFVAQYIHPSENRGAILRWATPAGTWPRTWEVVSSTQLFPATLP